MQSQEFERAKTPSLLHFEEKSFSADQTSSKTTKKFTYFDLFGIHLSGGH
jgi:hypothetical protein